MRARGERGRERKERKETDRPREIERVRVRRSRREEEKKEGEKKEKCQRIERRDEVGEWRSGCLRDWAPTYFYTASLLYCTWIPSITSHSTSCIFYVAKSFE